MAICSSSFRCSHLANLSNEIGSGEVWNENWMIEVKVFGCPGSRNGELRSSVKAAALSVSSRHRKSLHLLRRERKRFEVRSMLQPKNEPESGDPAVTVLQEGVDASLAKGLGVSKTSFTPDAINGGGGAYSLGSSDGNGKFPSGGGGGGGGGGEDGSDHGEDGSEEEELGPIMKFEEVIKESEARGVSLPSDMLEAAKTVGIRKVLLLRYLDLQVLIPHPNAVNFSTVTLCRNTSFLFSI